MAGLSKIEWTEATWNPLTGCNKISPGCKNCYAEKLSYRLQKMGQANYKHGFKLTLHPKSLQIPVCWKKPRMIFVNSMSDLFHKEVPLSFIKQVFQVMNDCPQHTFQLLTKRADRLGQVAKHLNWTSNIWMGVSVESQKYQFRIDHLLKTPAKIRFLSLEPLLESLPHIKLKGIDWVIVGGESGPKSRPMQKQWVLNLRDQCLKKQVPFFFKQWGGPRKHKTGRLLNGKTWNQLPV